MNIIGILLTVGISALAIYLTITLIRDIKNKCSKDKENKNKGG